MPVRVRLRSALFTTKPTTKPTSGPASAPSKSPSKSRSKSRSRLPRGAALVGAVTVALAVPVVPVMAPAPVGAADAAARPVARAAGAPSAAQAATRLRVVDHNIEKRVGALDQALKAAARTGAAVITLQEVCWWQADRLIETRPEWTISWKPERNRDKCRRRSEGDSLLGAQRTVGNVAIFTGGPGGVASTHTFRAQRVTSDRAGLACVTWIDGARHHACSVHLSSPLDAGDTGTRTKQARDTRRITGRWLAEDDLVILGGDFNAIPKRRTMGYLYAHRGSGRFRESSARSLGRRECRCRQPTLDKRRQKIDYIFFSANRTGPRDFRTLRIVKTASDHHLLIGWADVDTSAR